MKVVPVTVLFSAPGPRLSTLLITAETAMEKGAEWLSIVRSAQVACDRGHEEHEKVYTTEWSGYFRGVKGTVVFFDASDGEKTATWKGGIHANFISFRENRHPETALASKANAPVG